MERRHPEGQPETITGKGPRGMNKVYQLIQGEPSDTDPKLSDEQRVQVIMDLMDIIPSIRIKKHARRGMR